jgi:hypothetical protein
LEGLIHSVVAASSNIPSRRSPPAIVAAVVVVAVLSICSNAFIRRYFYEVYLKLHLLLAGALFITLWFHIWWKSIGVTKAPPSLPFGQSRRTLAEVVLGISACFLASFSQCFFCMEIVPSQDTGQSHPEAEQTTLSFSPTLPPSSRQTCLSKRSPKNTHQQKRQPLSF